MENCTNWIPRSMHRTFGNFTRDNMARRAPGDDRVDSAIPRGVVGRCMRQRFWNSRRADSSWHNHRHRRDANSWCRSAVHFARRQHDDRGLPYRTKRNHVLDFGAAARRALCRLLSGSLCRWICSTSSGGAVRKRRYAPGAFPTRSHYRAAADKRPWGRAPATGNGTELSDSTVEHTGTFPSAAALTAAEIDNTLATIPHDTAAQRAYVNRLVARDDTALDRARTADARQRAAYRMTAVLGYYDGSDASELRVARRCSATSYKPLVADPYRLGAGGRL